MARLVVESGDESGMVYPLGAQPLLIGRGTECNLRVIDRRVSRQHAVVQLVNGSYTVEDLDSRNGTFVNHQPVAGTVMLRSGDYLAVGGTNFLFELETEDLLEKQRQISRVRISTEPSPNIQAQAPLDSEVAPGMTAAVMQQDTAADPMQRLRVLYQVSDALRGELEIDNLLSKIMDLVWKVMHPHRGVIMLRVSPDSRVLRPVVVKTQVLSDEDIIVSQSIIDQSIAEKSAILMTDAPNDARFGENHSIYAERIRSVICVPLVAQGNALGVVYVDLQDSGGYESRSFNMDDLELMAGITNQAALALEIARLHQEALKHQRMERELEIARDIQEQLLPAHFPYVPGLDVTAMCKPARQVGGDYYDFFTMSDGRVIIVLGDASGKGVPAAIAVAMLRTSLRTHLRMESAAPLDKVIEAINHSIFSDSLRDNFITLFALAYDPATQSGVYINAGQVPPLLVRANGDLERLGEGGMLLGAMPDSTYVSASVKLHPGDVIIMYSDGVPDTHNLAGDMYGSERLENTVLRSLRQSAAAICESINESVVQFRETREPFDDVTVVVVAVRDLDIDPPDETKEA